MSHDSVVAMIGLLITLWSSPADADSKAQPARFSRDVRPILSDKCFKCHGPDAKTRKASLRLDLLDEADYVLSAEDPENSELLWRITSSDPDERMPPPRSKLALSRQETETLRNWILQGAHYEQHWSFRPVQTVKVPEVQDPTWPRNPIDAFVLSRLEREGIAPAAEASRERLIRRVSFDLTGLPPTIDEIDAFLADDSDDAYERLVEGLLAKPEYGERMASDWFDVARYSDSYGYQVDRERFVWPWRDWVIRALNENLPYDQFIIWQLAGDLLPDATSEQVLATAFNRLHSQKVEGGSVPEEFRVEYVADRNHTFATAFLGLTLECARCHDHKYDPISQKEYYQLFAFFNNIDEAGLYSYFTQSVPTPTLLLADEAIQTKLAAKEKQIERHEGSLLELAVRRRQAFQQWLEKRPEVPEVPGRIAHLDFEDQDDEANGTVAGKVGRAVRLTGDDAVELEVGNFHRYEPFTVTLWLKTPDVKQRAVVFHRSRAWTDAGSRGYELLIEEGKLSAALIHFWPGNALRVRARQPLPVGEWVHVAVTYDGSSRAEGLRLFLDGLPVDCDVVRDDLSKNITGGGGDHLTIGARFRDRGFTGGMVDEFQVFSRQLSPIEVGQLYDGMMLSSAFSKPLDQLREDEKIALSDYYFGALDAEYQAALQELEAVRKQYCELIDPVNEIMVMRELSERRPTFVLRRGAYDAPGEPVEPDTPSLFPPLPAGEPRNRLGLAKWLTDPGHPLTARVAVNRFWQMFFGQGLVRTPEDFGSQGDSPTHLALLDWLARDFLDHGWDVKRLVRLIVTSATYRQSSMVSSDVQSRDPDNLLLARSPSYRLTAEMIRDGALAVSGLLRKQWGGAPVRPYEVAVSFKPVERDCGAGLYRRSLYTFWKRTAPAPVMMTLDASKRDVCSVRRERTSSPLQALVLLNDPQRVEAARMLAQRLLQKHGGNDRAVMAEMFRVLTSRRPEEEEMEILTRLYEAQFEHFEQNADQAEEFLATGDAARDGSIAASRLAAAGVLAIALMNFDDCVVKR